MADLWHPNAVAAHAPEASWDSYVAGPYRGVIHTAETKNYSYDPNSYYGNNYWPHATIGSHVIYQHIPINRAARALEHRSGWVDTNNYSAVQCEVLWNAADAENIPLGIMDALAGWMRWVETTVGVTRTSVKFYGEGDGDLSETNSFQRMSTDAWKAFTGWCGHQHVPGNVHWDPGRINIGYLLGGALPPHRTRKDDDDVAIVSIPPDGKAHNIGIPAAETHDYNDVWVSMFADFDGATCRVAFLNRDGSVRSVDTAHKVTRQREASQWGFNAGATNNPAGLSVINSGPQEVSVLVEVFHKS